MDKTLKVMVDEVSLDEVKGALPFPDLAENIREIVEISVERLQSEVTDIFENLFNILNSSSQVTGDYEISQVKVTLNINASGEVSLLSLAKGSASGQSGIEITISKKLKGSTSNG